MGAWKRSREGLSVLSEVAYKLGRVGDTPRFAGVKLRAPDATAAWGITRQIAGGEYRYEHLTPRQGWKVIDVGANIGVYSLWAERRGATVTAYEPGPETFEHLVANTKGKRIAARHAAVVGAHAATARLFLHGERSTRNTLIGREIETGEQLDASVEVPAIPLDEVLTDGCDLLKIDVEGSEFEILANVSEENLRRAKRIVLEFHRTAGPLQTLLDRLAAAGFRAEILDDAGPFGVIGAMRS